MRTKLIALTRAWDAAEVAHSLKASYRVIVADPPYDNRNPSIHRDGDHLHLRFHDAVEPAVDKVLATEEQIAALIDFAHTWSGEYPLIINCYAGKSRSSSVLIVMLTALFSGRERQIIEMVATKAAHVSPNRHVISLGDRLLGCGGALIAAIEAMPVAVRGFTGTVFFDLKSLREPV